MFNPIKLSWPSFRAAVKRDMSEQLSEIFVGEHKANLHQTEFSFPQF